MPARQRRQVEVRQLVASGLSDHTLIQWTTAARRRLPPRRGLVSIATVSPAMSRQINRRYRHKNRPTNVLSFSLADVGPIFTADRIWGEIILCPAVIRREARQNDRGYRNYFRFLLGHGLIHLLGLDHHTAAEQRTWHRYEQRLQL